MGSVFIIAEAGVNHDGSLKKAKELVDIAVSAGADAVKFQTWITELIVTRNAALAEYQKDGEKASQYEMLKGLELSRSEFFELKNYCDDRKIEFMSTPDEEESAEFLAQIVQRFKIGSGELNNLPFLKKVASFQKEVILSTGMGTFSEIERAVDALLEAGLERKQLSLLHAVSAYPAPFSELNLRCIPRLIENYSCRVGFSDHSPSITAPVAAVALGAVIVEKHFTYDRNAKGPDHKASLSPNELRQMVEAIRQTEEALGDGNKKVEVSESDNLNIVRKSIVARRGISKGEVFAESNLCCKRPATGLSPERMSSLLGKTAKFDYSSDEAIRIEEITD